MGFGQNNVVLSYLEPKRRRFGPTNFFFKFCLYQNDAVLDKTAAKRRRFGAAITNPKLFCPKRRRFVIYKKNKINTKRRRFVACRDKTTSFCRLQRQNDVVSNHRLPKNEFPVSLSSLQRSGGGGGGGGGGREKTGPTAGGRSVG